MRTAAPIGPTDVRPRTRGRTSDDRAGAEIGREGIEPPLTRDRPAGIGRGGGFAARPGEARVAAGAFVVYEVIAGVWLLVLGHRNWFSNDEWDFLAGRTAFDVHDLLRPHNEHLSVLPILVFRAMWTVVGMRSYVPYLTLIGVLHLTTAALLRAVMRRAGVGPWIATLAASILVLFGTGAVNIEFAFQIGFVGALVCGLAALLLTDRDGPLDRHDAAGLALGLAAVLSSGVGVAMVIVVAVSTLMRRGWRVAAFHAVPAAVLFVTWFAVIGRTGYDQRKASIAETVRSAVANVGHLFRGLGQLPGVGVVLGVMLVTGLVLAWKATYTGASPERETTRLNTIIGLVAGAFAFLVSTAVGRGHVPESFGVVAAHIDEPQIMYVLAALVLAPLAVAATAIIRRWAALAPVVCIVLLVGIPGNVDKLVDQTRAYYAYQRDFRRDLFAVLRVDAVRQLPRSFRPSPLFARELTLGWLRDGIASDKIPEGHPWPRQVEATSILRQMLRPATRTQARDCSPVAVDQPVPVPKNGSIHVRAREITVVAVMPDGVRSSPLSYPAPWGSGGRLALSAAIPLVLEVDVTVAAPAGPGGGMPPDAVVMCPPRERSTARS